MGVGKTTVGKSSPRVSAGRFATTTQSSNGAPARPRRAFQTRAGADALHDAEHRVSIEMLHDASRQ